MRTRLAIALPLIGVLGCAGAGGIASEQQPEWQRVRGMVDPAVSATPMIWFPTEIHATIPFDVTVTTLGSSSCTRPDGIDVRLAGSVAEITPYDRVPRDPVPCTRDLAFFPRTVSVTFPNPGDAAFRVYGRSAGGDTVSHIVPVRVLPRG